MAVIVLEDSAARADDECEDSYEEQAYDGLRDVPIYVAPDLAFRLVSGPWVVLDWKTGPAAGGSEQLALYALALQDEVGPMMCPLPIEGRVAGLDTGTCRTVSITRADVEEARRRVAASVATMRLKLDDPSRNIASSPAAFELATDRCNCPRCPFYELCRREL